MDKKESREFMREKYHTGKSKILMALAMIAVYFLLFAAFFFALGIGADPLLLIILGVAILLFIPISVFLIDEIFYENE